MSDSSSSPDPLDAVDVLLHPYLRAKSNLQARWYLNGVFVKHIIPRCEAILHSKFSASDATGCSTDPREDRKDLRGAVILSMWIQLEAMLQEYQTAQVITKPIRDVRGYTAMTTFNAWKGWLRISKPGYHQVYRFVRALLMNHEAKDNMPQMAVWKDVQSKGCTIQVGGLALWRDQKRPSVYSDRLQVLLRDPKAGLGEAWTHAGKSEPLEVSDPLSLDGLRVIFAWLNHPVPLDHLTTVLCEATGRIDAPPLPPSKIETTWVTRPDEDVTPFMQMFGECVHTKMTPRERAAILLGGEDPHGVSLLKWMIESMVVTDRELAAEMDMPLITLITIWPNLPLADKAIAKVMGCKVSSVRDARFDARAKFRKFWEEGA